MLRAALSLIISFFAVLLLMPLIISLSKRLKLRQTVLHYVDNHASKSGTPTMGGVAFIIAASFASLTFMTSANSLAMIVVIVMAGYGIIGFLDDFIKVFFKQNKGLSPWQKILFQVIIAVIVSLYAFYNPYVLDTIFLPFSLKELSLGIFSVPFYIFMFLAFTNSVNLTDGLDGLASSVTIVFSAIFAVIIALIIYFFGAGQAFAEEYQNLIILCTALIGALIGFVCYNGFPAKIFMGDTGSLALGGALAGLAVMSRLSLNAAIVGIMYVLTSISVILQVGYFKRTKKRIFLMAPLHHHFERKGIHENKIVIAYSVITLIAGLINIAVILGINAI